MTTKLSFAHCRVNIPITFGQKPALNQQGSRVTNKASVFQKLFSSVLLDVQRRSLMRTTIDLKIHVLSNSLK